MRAYHMTKVIVAAVAAMLAITLSTMAADQGGGSGGQNQQDRVQQQLDRMATQLELTDAQKKQLKPILEEQGKKMREIFQDQNLSQEERREKMTKLREQYNAQFKKILTTEQYQKWEKAAAERRQNRGQGGGRGQRQGQ